MANVVNRLLRGIEVDQGTLAFDVLKAVGPGGHFFGTAHTLGRYETAFYTPLLSDWRNYEVWKETGGDDTTVRANRIWKALLQEYQRPPIDPAVDEELRAFVRRRKSEIGNADV